MSEPYWSGEGVQLWLGDCLDILPTIPDASVDAVICDPPYELGFMGKTWDTTGIAYNADVWQQCWRILKPGGHLAAFGGTRTYHRMACAIEDSGFEIRDSLHWIYGSGFPKSHDVSKGIDNAAGATREVIGHTSAGASSLERVRRVEQGYRKVLTNVDTAAIPITAPATDEAARWTGWGTALKPSHEPIVLARKPLQGTVAANVLLHGTGAINVDACRTEAGQDYREKRASVVGIGSPRNGDTLGDWTGVREDSAHPAGRWPANVLLGHGPDCGTACQSGCPVAEMDQQSGASRFFPVFRYEAKAPASERPRLADGTTHTTVKPLGLMRWLVRLLTPPGGLVLDPFAGSGTTLEAAVTEGASVLGIEQQPEYAALCAHRLEKAIQPALFGDIA